MESNFDEGDEKEVPAEGRVSSETLPEATGSPQSDETPVSEVLTPESGVESGVVTGTE